MKLHSHMDNGFYGSYARFLLFFARNFTRKKTYMPPVVQVEAKDDTSPSAVAPPDFAIGTGPAVYVCRHLNMHGPYSCIKWLPFSIHPMILDVFFDRKTTQDHLLDFTFSEKRHKKPGPWLRFVAWLAGIFFPPLVHSSQAVPVHRDNNSYSTLKAGLHHLMKDEPLAVWPDIAYTANYGKTSEIYHGFLFLGELYFRRTGESLPFIPLVVDDKNRRLIAGTPITCDNFRQNGDAAAEALKEAINTLPK